MGSSSRVDVVNVTQSIIQNYGALVDSAYVIENDNIDSVVYWQKSSGEIFRTVGNSKPLYVADSLLEYVNL